MMSYTLAAACHDVGHPGVNNIFLIETKAEMAIRYNDSMVLENFHVATTFEILKTPKYNLFSDLTKT
jgi:hypothetical protein